MTRSGYAGFGFFEAAAALLLLLYPSLMFAVKGGMNGAFLLLLLVSIGALLMKRTPPWDRDTGLLMLAMAAMPAAIFLSQSYHQHYSGHPYDAASRYLLAVPVFMLLRGLPFNVVAIVQYGFPLAAIAGCLMLRPISDGRYGIATLDLIHFGDFELMLGALSVFAIDWTGRDKFWQRALKILGLLAGVYASIASGSRGGWIALPVFMMIYLYFRLGRISLKTWLAVPLALVVAGLLAFASSDSLQQRVDALTSDLTLYQQGNRDTSLGIRLQLFHAAAEIFAQNPVFGVGPEGFALEMEPMQKAGKLTALAAELGRGEVHNEWLSKAAGLGVFGVIAMAMLYLLPLGIFYRASRSAIARVRQSGVLGMVFVSGFLVFGLTVEILNLTMAAAFYALTLAVLLAATLNIHRGEKIAVQQTA